ncbi:hypothetical protein C361_06829 [Cryptococcus neoformans Tu259-1]|uniref:Uncharacterized protein n=1 Tax=Cryptococcus neoformans Tu259-1 TaxID=1230072 RepID=A0A854Q234_CRYNE|nr:hypothetical protein C361_06829 [Cryptococcus neoformans var. grubii Tu259-1]
MVLSRKCCRKTRVREHQRPKIAGRFEFKNRHSPQKDGIFTCDIAPHITSRQSSASSGIRYRPRRVPSLVVPRTFTLQKSNNINSTWLQCQWPCSCRIPSLLLPRAQGGAFPSLQLRLPSGQLCDYVGNTFRRGSFRLRFGPCHFYFPSITDERAGPPDIVFFRPSNHLNEGALLLTGQSRVLGTTDQWMQSFPARALEARERGRGGGSGGRMGSATHEKP